MRTLILLLLFSFLPHTFYSQADTISRSLKVFVNCQFCYEEYLRTQITWVDFVQDQFVSEVDIMVATINTGSGGADYKLYFTGKQAFTGMTDTLHFVTSAINTDSEIRDMLIKRVKLGLVRYASRTGLMECLELSSSKNKDNQDIGIGSNAEDDPWNAWVFRVNANGNVDAQKVFQSGYFNGSFSASQVKEDHKLSFSAGFNYSEQRFNYDGEKSSYVLRGQYGNLDYVHSLSDHWSAGVFNNARKSDFSNYDYYQSSTMAIEYNIFPYQKAQTNVITIYYYIGGAYHDFQDTTIFNKATQLIPIHGINMGSSFTQKWGSFGSGLSATAFLNDQTKYRYGGWMNLEIRIFKGLSFSAYASFNVVRDQINIRKLDASDAEVLLQQKELQTDFNFSSYLGLNYRFGSIYNNVVNPRFNYGN